MNLGYGRQDEDEDFIIGTEEGLNNLINACQIALKSEETSCIKLGEFYGVKKVEETYWEEENSTITSWLLDKTVVPVIVILFVSSLLVGLVTIVKWLFN